MITVSLTTLRHIFFCNHGRGWCVCGHRGGCYFIILLVCVFLIKKTGKVMHRDGTKAGRQAACPVPSSTLLALCQRTLLSYACNLTHHLPGASSILIECFYLRLVCVITACRTSEGCINVSVCVCVSLCVCVLCPGHKRYEMEKKRGGKSTRSGVLTTGFTRHWM